MKDWALFSVQVSWSFFHLEPHAQCAGDSVQYAGDRRNMQGIGATCRGWAQYAGNKTSKNAKMKEER
jgi:hypothetical protein